MFKTKLGLSLGVLFVMALMSGGCATSATFKIPANTKLTVTGRTVEPDENGVWRTTPFFWSSAGGAKYTLTDNEGKEIRTGKVKTRFRVVSIFWPPAALIYWPFGFAKDEYDLTMDPDEGKIKDVAEPKKSEEKPKKISKKKK